MDWGHVYRTFDPPCTRVHESKAGTPARFVLYASGSGLVGLEAFRGIKARITRRGKEISEGLWGIVGWWKGRSRGLPATAGFGTLREEGGHPQGVPGSGLFADLL
jgi:hypothetical protein